MVGHSGTHSKNGWLPLPRPSAQTTTTAASKRTSCGMEQTESRVEGVETPETQPQAAGLAASIRERECVSVCSEERKNNSNSANTNTNTATQLPKGKKKRKKKTKRCKDEIRGEIHTEFEEGGSVPSDEPTASATPTESKRQHESKPGTAAKKESGNKKKAKPEESSKSRKRLNQVQVRPGKKKRRMLRYQQQHLPQQEFRLVIAKHLLFTGSVSVSEFNKEEQSTAGDPTRDTITSSLTVFTMGEIPPSINNARRSQIHVQPLLVLDINGLLCHRIRGKPSKDILYRDAVAVVAQTPVIPRTDIRSFLSFLDQHFCLAVWTSAKDSTASVLVKTLFPQEIADRLLFVWDQRQCSENPSNENGGKDEFKSVVFEKDLDKVFEEFPLWNSSNCLIVDDSPDKCSRWHSNAVHPPSLNGQKTANDSSIITLDEENEKRQRIFFDGLVAFWRQHTLVQTWQQTGEKFATQMETIDGKQDVLSGDNGMLCYLKEHASGWMGRK